MTHPRILFLLLIVIVAFHCRLTLSQEVNSTPNDLKAAEQALREKAFRVLESVASQLGTMQSAENRARIGSNLVDSLWKHDEQRARNLLDLVEQDIRVGVQYRKSDDPRDLHTFRVFLNLRQDTVNRIAKYDPELALSFLNATKPSPNKSLQNESEASDNYLELRLAKTIAVNNPEVALKLGRQSLARGFSHDLVSFLTQLHLKHKEHGIILYKEVVSKLRNVNLSSDWNSMYFARMLADSLTPPLAEESSYRELQGVFTANAAAIGCAKLSPRDYRVNFCREITNLTLRMETPTPRQEDVVLDGTDLSRLAEGRSVDEILALATKHPEISSYLSWQAMFKALGSGDVERARRIASGYAGDSENRERMIAEIERIKAWTKMDAETLAILEQRLNELDRPQHRIDFLMSVAMKMSATDRGGALKLLNRANGIIEEMKSGSEQTSAQISLASIYCLQKSDRGLAMMEFLVPRLNDLVSAAVKLDGFDTRYLRDGEWNMSGEGGVGSLLKRLAENAGYFGWCDFDRAVNLSAQFERTEIRLMAQLKLAQGVLAGPPKRLNMMLSID